MMKCSWRFAVITCLLTGMWFIGRAQQEYFIFLQSDQQHPFYARVGEKIYSSSGAGHLVVSGLKDSTYSVFIGFPKNQRPEMEFVIPLSKKDQGFQLKDMGEQGWNLFNFLTLQLLKPKATPPKSTAFSPEIKKKTDNYSRLMAGVVNDTAVLYATFIPSDVSDPVVKQTVNVTPVKEKPVSDTPAARLENGVVNSSKNENKIDSTLISGDQKSADASGSEKITEKEKTAVAASVTPARDTVLVKTETTTAKSVDSTVNTKETVSVFRDSANRQLPIPGTTSGVLRIAEEKRNDGVQLKYVVKESTGNADTVIAFVQYADPETGKPAADRKDTIAVERKQSTSIPETDNNNAAGRLVMINSDCRHFASERDVDKLRIKILSERKDNEKLDVVKKEYRTKCYTSRQVKALSELFYQDPLRFEFLSASFPFVSDSENFRELVSLLRDPVYIEKFEGLFKN